MIERLPFMNCPVCGRFCSNSYAMDYFTGTWNDTLLEGTCSTHGKQTVSTV